MSGSQERFGKECKPRESREVCHQSFWCGEEIAHGINLSHGGMCFRMARRAEPGEVVTIHHGPSLQVKARIAWTRRLDTCTEVGVQFFDTKSNTDRWLEFLRVETEVEKVDANGEPILALPAPGQTYRPAFHNSPFQFNNRIAGSISSRTSGASWKAAIHLMGSGSQNGSNGTER